jgi:hypothetical protein
MTRISSLLLATSLAILPIGAFAQQNATPGNTPGNTPMAQPTAPAAQTTQTGANTLASGAKTAVSTKDSKSTSTKDRKSTHAKLGTKASTMPAKTAESGKS